MLIQSVRSSLFITIPTIAVALAGCGTTAGNEGTGADGAGSTVSGAGSSGHDSDGHAGSKGSNGGSGGTMDLDVGGLGPAGGSSVGGGAVTPIPRDKACATSSAVADPIPAVVQMVVDISGSMNWVPGTERGPRNGQQSKWEITALALKDAVAQLPATVALGLNFYPNGDSEFECIQNRIALPIGLLGAPQSMQRQDFETAIDDALVEGGTPTHAAFAFGATTVAASQLQGRKFVLLITDGVPTYTLSCDGDGQSAVDTAPLIAAVSEAHTQNAIDTFVIGSPGSEDARADLSKMASAGGTATPGCSDSGPNYCHLDMTTAQNFASALAAGLREIAGQINSCEYAVPAAPGGKSINPKQVNVLYTKGDGSMASIPQDATGTCGSGWRYDNPAAPSKITLCGSDCDKVKADHGAKIDVIFGCDTETNGPVK